MTRSEMLKRAQAQRGLWDFVIIGGGATGVGVAVDAASRGYRTLLLEMMQSGLSRKGVQDDILPKSRGTRQSLWHP